MQIKTNTSKYNNEEVIRLFEICASLLGDCDLSDIEISIRTCRRHQKYRQKISSFINRLPHRKEAYLAAIAHYESKYYRGMYKYGKNIKITPKIVMTLAPQLPLIYFSRIILHELTHHQIYLIKGPKYVGGRYGERLCREKEHLAPLVLDSYLQQNIV